MRKSARVGFGGVEGVTSDNLSEGQSKTRKEGRSNSARDTLGAWEHDATIGQSGVVAGNNVVLALNLPDLPA